MREKEWLNEILRSRNHVVWFPRLHPFFDVDGNQIREAGGTGDSRDIETCEIGVEDVKAEMPMDVSDAILSRDELIAVEEHEWPWDIFFNEDDISVWQDFRAVDLLDQEQIRIGVFVPASFDVEVKAASMKFHGKQLTKKTLARAVLGLLIHADCLFTTRGNRK